MSDSLHRSPSAFPVLWMLSALAIAWACAQYLFSSSTFTAGGFLGWEAEETGVFHWRMFILLFAALSLPAPVARLLRKDLPGALLDLIWTAASCIGFFFFAPALESSQTESGLFGWNEQTHHSFATDTFMGLFTAALVLLWTLHYLRLRRVIHRWKLRLLLFILCGAALAAYFTGLHTPVFFSEKFYTFREEVALTDTVTAFIHAREYFLAAIILVFTILFPLAKFIATFWSLLAPHSTAGRKLHHALALLGKWSMLDVFVVALLILAVKLDGGIVSMQMREGLVWFAAAILVQTGVSAVRKGLE